MEHQEPYKTISSPGLSEFRDRNSKFLGTALEVNSEEEVKAALEEIASNHPKSRHVVHAFRIGQDGHLFRASDDGEPSGSSGMPVYNQIKSADLHNVLVAVVRYFGGTKLGIPGLINAYGEAARLAIENAEIKWVKPCDPILVKADYAHMGKLMDELKSAEKLEMIRSDFTNGIEIETEIEKGYSKEVIQRILCNMVNVPFDPDRSIRIEGLVFLSENGEKLNS